MVKRYLRNATLLQPAHSGVKNQQASSLFPLHHQMAGTYPFTVQALTGQSPKTTHSVTWTKSLPPYMRTKQPLPQSRPSPLYAQNPINQPFLPSIQHLHNSCSIHTNSHTQFCNLQSRRIYLSLPLPLYPATCRATIHYLLTATIGHNNHKPLPLELYSQDAHILFPYQKPENQLRGCYSLPRNPLASHNWSVLAPHIQSSKLRAPTTKDSICGSM